MHPARAPEAGLTVGAKYRLVRRIGVGGMGEVWVAKNRTTGAEVAVKMGLGAAAREDSALRFRHEARLGAMLSHRSIVRIFDLVEEGDETLVLVMELLRGESLDRYLHRSGPLSTAQAIAIAIPILSALAHAHDSGIVHRDVTPANVFLSIDPDGHVTPKLLDFGIAKIPTTTLTRTIDGRVLGTPAYMAPERIREQGDVDGRSDLFSVGVILYEMLTGVCPFAATSPAACLAAVLEAVVDPDPRIDPRIWLEVRRSLAKQPYQRSPTAAAMAKDLLAASGLTEAALTEALRDAPLSRTLSGEIADALAPTRTVTGHSLARAAAVAGSRRARVIAWAAGFLVACTGLAGGMAIRNRSAAAMRPPSPATLGTIEGAALAASSPSSPSAAAVESSTRASPSAVSVEAAAIGPSTKSSATSMTGAAPGPSAHPARPPRRKPVATTPGF
jgi:eukaryotic-like serine/threonine-protein kinase